MTRPQAFVATPPMSPARAQEIASSFDLRDLPPDFYANPYPVYQALREREPVRHMPDGSYFLTRYADVVAVYRDAQTFSSDKKVEFAPKYNKDSRDSPLFQHHTTSLVFNDPPLHTRVRKLIMGALTRRAIADMENGLVALVDNNIIAYTRQGNREDARAAFEQVVKGFAARLAIGADEPFTRYYVACASAMMGDKEAALEHLAKAIEGRRNFNAARARVEIDFESLRDDPKFQTMIA